MYVPENLMGAWSSQTVSPLLGDASAGKQGAADALFPIVSAEVFRRECTDQTLESTARVHEAYLRWVDHNVSFQNRAHFLGIATQSRRDILSDHSKPRSVSKRSGRDYTLRVDEGMNGREAARLESDRDQRRLSRLENIESYA